MKDLIQSNLIVYNIEPQFIDQAIQVSIQRRNFHRSYGSVRHWSDSSKGEYGDEFWGVLGEILFRHHIIKHGLDSISEFPELFTTQFNESTPKYDAKVGGKTIEIKSIPPDSGGKRRIRMLIKESEFHDDDYYVAIKFWDMGSYSFCGYLTRENVRSAKLTDLPYSRGYSFYLSELHPMTVGFYKN